MKYIDKVEELRQKIKDDDITVILVDSGLINYPGIGVQCYFCQKTIEDNVRILVQKQTINGYVSFDNFPVDSRCYARAKSIELVK